MTAEHEPSGSKRIGRFEPLTQLATGGMAEIWLARERGVAGLERFVVLKRLLSHLASDRSVVEMFVSEARFVARLVHPNVVQIHELAEDEQGYFLVMEYVAGCSVRELMSAADKAGRKLPPEVGLCIIEQACRGAHAAHELTDSSGRPLGLVHRDISPHNLMIAPGGDVKLLDFGIAKATALAEATHTGSLKGKFGYMSPEQCRARRLDRRSDVFALGVVLWELLVGKRLFVRDSEFESMQAIVSGEHQLPSEARSELPAALDAVLEKALAKAADDRWQTADELRHALVEASERAGLRPSRDVVGELVVELLGERLEQRQQALLEAAERTGDAIDRSALHHALVGPDSAERHSASSHTGRSASSVPEDGATVVQRRSSRPAGDLLASSGDRPSVPTVDRTPFPPLGDPLHREGDSTLDRTRVDRASAELPPVLPGELVDGHASRPMPAPDPTSADPVPAPAEGASRPADLPLPPVEPAASSSASGVAVPSAPAPPPPEARPSRAPLLALVGLLVVAAAVAAVVGSGIWPGSRTSTPAREGDGPPLSGPPLRFVVPPTVQPGVIRRELAPFARWLGGRMGRRIEVELADSYQDAGLRVASGRAELGLLPPLLYVQTVAREPRVRPVVLRLYDGSRGSDGYLLVRDDEPFSQVQDLRGHPVCLVDRESTTGFLLPRIAMRRVGIDPDRDVRTVLSGDHLAALRDLSARRCDAAAVYSGAYLSAAQEGIRVGALRVLAITGRVPQDVVAVAPDLPERDVARLREILLAFRPERDIDAARVGEVLGISGFAPFEATELAVIREAARAEGLLPGADAGTAAAEGDAQAASRP